MRQRLFHRVGFSILLTLLSAAATPAQAADDAEAIRRQITELKQSLKQMEKDFDKAMAKQRAEWELNLKKLQQESMEAFSKRHAEFAHKIEALQQREESIKRKAEAKEKGFYVKVEIKGRLEKRVYPEHPLLFGGVEQVTWFEVIAGDVKYELDFKKNAALIKLAESKQHKTLLVTGIVVGNNRLEVQTLEAVKD